MTLARRLAGACALAIASVACAPTLPPSSLTQADSVAKSAALVAAREAAPIAYAQADKLRRQARAAFDAGDFASSQIMAEEALAAYQEALAEARVARAEDAAVRSEDAAAKASKRLATIDAEQSRMEAEIEALERQLQVLKALEIPRDSGKADSDRAKARKAATRTLRLQAQLLCTAATLLNDPDKGGAKPSTSAKPTASKPGAKSAGSAAKSAAKQDAPLTPRAALNDARAKLRTLDELLRKSSDQPPIDHAMRARAACLNALTLARRTRTDVSRAPGAADALLSALGGAGVGAPSRDDRGVVLTLRDVFEGDALAKDSQARIGKLAKVVAAHGPMPVVVVLHQQKALDAKLRQRATARGSALVSALKKAMRDRNISDAVLAGDSAPIVDPEGKHKARNERVEIVFVTPET